MAKRTKAARTKRATKRTASRSRGSKSDAIRLLKEDHQRVEQLFKEFENARRESQKARLAEQICNELKVHAQIEEELFYPVMREAIKESDLIDEAAVEHATAKDLISQIEKMSPGDELFEAKVTVLGEYVRHHVKEEESEIFPRARKSGVDLAAMGEQLMSRKQQLMNGASPMARPSIRPGRRGISPGLSA